MCFWLQRRANFRHWYVQKCSEPVSLFDILTCKCVSRYSACIFLTSEPQKVPRKRQFLSILTWTCASPDSGVHFFDIGPSKSAPAPLRCEITYLFLYASHLPHWFHLQSWFPRMIVWGIAGCCRRCSSARCRQHVHRWWWLWVVLPWILSQFPEYSKYLVESKNHLKTKNHRKYMNMLISLISNYFCPP